MKGADVITEMEWEREMFRLGSEAFVDAQEKADLENSHAGRKVLKLLVFAYAEAIKTLQADLIKSQGERESKGPLLMLPAEVLALIALKRVLSPATVKNYSTTLGETVVSICKNLGDTIEEEINFRHWVTSSKKQAKEWAKTHGINGSPTSFAERLIKDQGVNRMSLSRWRKTFAELSEYEWDTTTHLNVGALLLECLCKTFPDYFEMEVAYLSGRKTTRFRMTPDMLELMNQKFEMGRLFAAARLPMLSKPKRWATDG